MELGGVGVICDEAIAKTDKKRKNTYNPHLPAFHAVLLRRRRTDPPPHRAARRLHSATPPQIGVRKMRSVFWVITAGFGALSLMDVRIPKQGIANS